MAGGEELKAWSSYSGNNGGECVEVGNAPWRKSSYSGNNGTSCVEIGAAAPGVVMRDTTDRAAAVLSFPAAAWQAFAAALRA